MDIVQFLASLPAGTKEVNQDAVRDATGLDHTATVHALKALAAQGKGKYVVGRRGHPSRFQLAPTPYDATKEVTWAKMLGDTVQSTPAPVSVTPTDSQSNVPKVLETVYFTPKTEE